MGNVYLRNGSPHYQFRIKTSSGYQRISTKQSDLNEAQKFADEYEAALKRKTGFLFSTAHALYVRRCSLRKKTLDGYSSSHRMITKTIGDFYINELTVAYLEHYIKIRLSECGSTRIKRDLSYLSSLYNWVIMLPGGPDINPVEQVNKRKFKLREGQARTRWLTATQFEHLLSCCNQELHKAILIVAVETGMRRDEILQLRRGEVELPEMRIVIGNLSEDRTKTSEGRIVPLTDRALKTLDWLLNRHDREFVFSYPTLGKPVKAIHGWWYGLVERAGFADLRFHDLRHTFASWCAQRGVDERTVQAWLGHKTRSMTHRYQHLREAELHTAAKKFSAAGAAPENVQERNKRIILECETAPIETVAEKYNIAPFTVQSMLLKSEAILARRGPVLELRPSIE